ncbi:MAG: glutamine--tRNA ligase [Clostridiales bacterium GWF2_38_85]|nr:MAG: glutamine--tRNA ligase [Clostridiales bacterium GWF2_38_85]HBL84066.1 glutamine--tRNA ligase [Clostridiales bacterium]
MEETNNFLYEIIDSDLEKDRVVEIHTRFPPEPNGYLHIGSAKAIYINYTAAKKYGGKFNLRYDDTNPSKEDDEYVNSIYEDIMWLGAEPNGGIFYGSDYFDKCYEYAILLINKGLAYVCNLDADQLREYRGTLTEPGKDSPYRSRSIEENLKLFERMKNGELPNGYCTLRAKIDMTHPNMNMRDPAIYRILHMPHHRQGSKWCIYPLYDYAHPIQDALEGITHSMCSIEFENHRPLYDWVVNNIDFEKKPHQYEFARLNVTNTVMSKRYLRKLVETKIVDGWDDPRMPTICGLRRRGYTSASIFKFVELAGIAKNYSIVDISLLEHCIRDEMNMSAERRIAVIDPVKVIIENYPEDNVEYFNISNNPNNPEAGERQVAFTREIYIDRSDFSDSPPPKYFRLKPDGEVRLMGAYIIKYKDTKHDDAGNLAEIICTADLESGNKNPVDGRKVKGTIHWVSTSINTKANIVMYDKLFSIDNTNDIEEDKSYDDYLNPDSVKKFNNCYLEKSLEDAKPGDKFQLVRVGYFCKDIKMFNTFNLTVELRDSKPTK